MTASTDPLVDGACLDRLSVKQAYQRWQEGGTLLLDSRAATHFSMAHVLGAIHWHYDDELTAFKMFNLTTPIMVMCYHGISSKGIVISLLQQGFSTVYNIQGGFERWAAHYPMSIVHQGSQPSH
jgi:thiosulfate sulfurtransferase